MKSLIKKLLIEGLTKEVKLVSKSKKGNKIFKQLETAQFQHYDAPKGELSDFTHGEEDRKRLVSKLSKEDKKTYRAWLKTPEGEASIKLFNDKASPGWKDGVKESETIIDKFGDEVALEEGWGDLKFPVKEYKTNVKDCLVDIIMRENGISEKNFSGVDETIKQVGSFFKTNGDANNIIKTHEGKKSRPEYVAEMIYNELYK